MLVFLFTTTIGPFLCLFYHNIAEEDDVLSSIVIVYGEKLSCLVERMGESRQLWKMVVGASGSWNVDAQPFFFQFCMVLLILSSILVF